MKNKNKTHTHQACVCVCSTTEPRKGRETLLITQIQPIEALIVAVTHACR
ncbi:hypothetical protein HanIR_Chr16g0829871 [Helianthus annuus]|nr:hypothetical protein HanIR_Chr16g0829871 [Helianthus annuus]